ncbi:hypothetical protein IWQ62_002381 [Dispira parvispora]|uniref:NodB homology domain-containing protein n=1 Tax=Dispira parvispora TaxID=1520584 RepID=A0A9W8E7I9_9FUNG|nr:hypothetical protein IWQ62_002381 [Dispira parvispora]
MAFVGLQSVGATTTECSPGKWALTFDDGPHPSISLEILSLLRKNNAKATFFVVGKNVADNPGILRQIYEDGHEIGVHTWNHLDLTSLNTNQIRKEIGSTVDVIYQTVGVRPTLARPPFGNTNELVRGIMKEFGLEGITWNVDSNDWRYAQEYHDSYEAGKFTEEELFSHLKDKDPSTTGVISLQHDVHEASVYITGEVIRGIRTKGFSLTTVKQCISGPNNSYTVPPAPTATTSSSLNSTVTIGNANETAISGTVTNTSSYTDLVTDSETVTNSNATLTPPSKYPPRV